jgi:hypothetical protein
MNQIKSSFISASDDETHYRFDINTNNLRLIEKQFERKPKCLTQFGAFNDVIQETVFE